MYAIKKTVLEGTAEGSLRSTLGKPWLRAAGPSGSASWSPPRVRPAAAAGTVRLTEVRLKALQIQRRIRSQRRSLFRFSFGCKNSVSASHCLSFVMRTCIGTASWSNSWQLSRCMRGGAPGGRPRQLRGDFWFRARIVDTTISGTLGGFQCPRAF